MALLSTITVNAAAAAAPRRRWLSFWSLGETAGGDEVVGVVVRVVGPRVRKMTVPAFLEREKKNEDGERESEGANAREQKSSKFSR